MAEIIIDGKAVAAAVNAENARKCEELAKKYGSRPGLAVVLVGDDPASQVYVSSKVRKCGELGIYSEKIVLPKDSTQQQVLDVIDTLNKNPEIHGILVQSPPPPQISEEEIILAIDPKKDVDCFHPYNTGRSRPHDHRHAHAQRHPQHGTHSRLMFFPEKTVPQFEKRPFVQ